MGCLRFELKKIRVIWKKIRSPDARSVVKIADKQGERWRNKCAKNEQARTWRYVIGLRDRHQWLYAANAQGSNHWGTSPDPEASPRVRLKLCRRIQQRSRLEKYHQIENEVIEKEKSKLKQFLLLKSADTVRISRSIIYDIINSIVIDYEKRLNRFKIS